jgi:ADP-ribose pyrophosphatase YjhB (NUDIX family)
VTLPLREGVRAVVLDADDRILLVHFEFPDRTWWATPGGGVESGETREVAIRRELREEVGLVDVELGPIIWERTHVFDFAEFSGQREKFFLVRASTNVVDPSFTHEELLAEGVTGSRWWTTQEIRDASATHFAPRRLASLLDELLVKGPPEVIIDTGD